MGSVHRVVATPPYDGSATPRPRRAGLPSIAAVLLLWAALVAPHRPGDLQPAAFLRLPLEALVLVAVLLVLPPRLRRPLAALAGLALALLCLLKVLDLLFHVALDRPFDAVTDSAYADSAVSLLFDSVGTATGSVVLAVVAVLALGLVVMLPLAALRVGALVSVHRGGAARAVTALLAAWAVFAVSGLNLGAGAIASTGAARLALDQSRQIRDGVRDEALFAQALSVDPLADVSARSALAGLHGKDVLIVFVESYGRFALEGPSSGPVNAVLAESTHRLRRAGFRSRSAFLTSPTSGGASWLAHATLQSGLWVDGEGRYTRLLASRRTTLTSLFRHAGWRTVMVIPSSPRPWREGEAFYRFHAMHGETDLGYAGPRLGYAKVPDQYTLEALHRLELARVHRRPVMAEVDLVSSHSPWTPLPHLVRWTGLGDGTIYDGMLDQGPSPASLWRDTDRLREAYTASIVYALQSLVGFVRRHGDDDLVLVVVGDHQPSSVVTGLGASHDVPISIIARDPAVIRRISRWGWQPGLRPQPDAPVWRMDAFRDRFLDAYGAIPDSTSTRIPVG